MRDVVRGLDANQPIFNVRTMEEFFQMRTLTIFNVIIGAVGAMGAMGMGLAIVGLYGLVAYAVSRRTREIGIRMAIGADRMTVLRMVLRQGMLLAVCGLLIGLAAGAGAEKWLQSAFPSGDNAFHPMALILVAPMVLAVTFIASYIPAYRASRLDPMKALRHD
jgi:ABC-type antimicrobial peptide transport system permease subunit